MSENTQKYYLTQSQLVLILQMLMLSGLIVYSFLHNLRVFLYNHSFFSDNLLSAGIFDTQDIFSMIISFGLIMAVIVILILLYFLSKIRKNSVGLLSTQKNKEIYKIYFDRFLHLSGNMIFFTDEYGNIIETNKNAEQVYGFSKDEFEKMNISRLFSDKSEKEFKGILKDVSLSENKIFNSSHKKKSGEKFNVEIREGHVCVNSRIYLIFIVRDISQEVELKEHVRLNEDRLQSIMDLLQIDTHSKDDILINVLENACRLTKSPIGYLYFYNEENEVFTNFAWSESVHKNCTMKEKPVVYQLKNTGLWGEAVRQRRPIITNDYQSPNPYKRRIPEGHNPLTRHMNVPIFQKDKIVAVIGMGNKETPYNESDVRQLILLMNIAWKIIDLFITEKELININTELEIRVHERTSQLETVIQELEDFSYSVSHDLRTPLRAIDGYSQLILDNYSSVLNETAMFSFNRIRSSSRRMAYLIESILGLVSLSRKEIDVQQVDMSKLAWQVMEMLKTANPEKEVKIVIQPDIIAECDSQLIFIVLQNLLENAWKFTSKIDNAKIEFGAISEKFNTIYFVKDNGAGFNMQYYKKLFGAFQRLHSSEEFSGSGIGLATVQRIINLHNGKIWANSLLGKQTTFYFTINTKISDYGK